MSIAALWDRFFWSFMLLVFAGLMWLLLIGDRARYLPFGLLTGLLIGGAYFVRGVRAMREANRRTDAAAAQADAAAAELRRQGDDRDA